MAQLLKTAAAALFCASLPAAAMAQAVQTDGDIETEGQVISTLPTGTAPLAVSSTTRVPNLNADQLDGLEGSDLYTQTQVDLLDDLLQAQIDALDAQLGAPAPAEETGQTGCWDDDGTPIACAGTGQDGDLRPGVEWPSPRLVDNGDGTITDQLTGLIWLEMADCFAKGTWLTALSDASGLADAACGLTDGSSAGDWRLPSFKELMTLVDYGESDPPLPQGHPFSGVQSDFYWSSTSNIGFPSIAWGVGFFSGDGNGSTKSGANGYVWPVRGGS